MKLAFNTWVYSSFPVWVPAYPLEVVIERLAAIGYDGIEIGAASPHAFPDYTSKERRREIKAALKANGIALASMLPAPGGGPGFNVASPIKEERAGAIDQYKKVVELCAEWGGKTCLYVAGWQVFGTTRDQAWEWSRAALVEIAKAGRDHGVAKPSSTSSARSAGASVLKRATSGVGSFAAQICRAGRGGRQGKGARLALDAHSTASK